VSTGLSSIYPHESSDITSLPFSRSSLTPPHTHRNRLFTPLSSLGMSDTSIANYVFKIDLRLGLINKPRISRTLSVPAPSTSNDPYHAVQAAFEWTKSHACKFSILSSTRLSHNNKLERAQTFQSDKPILTRPHYEYPANLGHLKEGLWRLTSEQPCRRHMILSKELNDRQCLRHSGILPATVVDALTE
jgi:hypothetical protein